MQKIEETIEEYRKTYNGTQEFENNQSVDPYKNIIVKLSDGSWATNLNSNPVSFYFSCFADNSDLSYTIEELYDYLYQFIKCVPISEKRTNKNAHGPDNYQIQDFMQMNRIEVYNTPQELAEHIIREMTNFESANITCKFKDLENMIRIQNLVAEELLNGITCYVNLKDAAVHIRRTILSLGMKKLSGAFKSVGGIAGYRSKYAENIVEYFAKQLKEKTTAQILVDKTFLDIFLEKGLTGKRAERAAREYRIILEHELCKVE